MTRHMLLQLPLLAFAGWLASALVPASARMSNFDGYGIPGLLVIHWRILDGPESARAT